MKIFGKEKIFSWSDLLKQITNVLKTENYKVLKSHKDAGIMKETLEKYEKQFNSIKSVCCKYFEKYDIELEAVSIKT